MAVMQEDVDAFLKFAPEDKWLVLAMTIIDPVKPEKVEMRLGLNLSPFLERYVACYKNGGVLYFIPLFSSHGDPGLFIYGEKIDTRLYFRSLKTIFGDRFWLEEVCTDWPDNAGRLMMLHDDPTLTILDGRIVSRPI